VDHYGVDQRWERRMRGAAQRILVVDDLADRQHDCDLLLDQNLPPTMERRYDRLVPPSCQQFLGPRYALLREEFRELRTRLRTRSGEIRRVLVMFGGGDPTNETGKAVEGLRQAEIAGLEADVVIGSLSAHADRIRAQCAGLGWMKVYENTGEVAALMERADLSIGAGGTTSWERCMVGLPAVTLAIAENQVEVLQGLASVKAVRYLGWRESVGAEDIAKELLMLHSTPDVVKKMGEASSELAGAGDGVEAVAGAMLRGAGV
jgi:UDP-2,4-diacetamido-2,4,6-trideoxy-beta-L-altropyranose hydrolase